jgi:hypothetical protein
MSNEPTPYETAFPPTETAVCEFTWKGPSGWQDSCGLRASHEYHDHSACAESHEPVETCHPFRARPSASTVETARAAVVNLRVSEPELCADWDRDYYGGKTQESLIDYVNRRRAEPVAPTPVEPPQECAVCGKPLTDAPYDREALCFGKTGNLVGHQSWREATVPESPAPPHDFKPVNGHPDDDECTHREDGTDASYCGLSRAEHPSPAPQEASEWRRVGYHSRYSDLVVWVGPKVDAEEGGLVVGEQHVDVPEGLERAIQQRMREALETAEEALRENVTTWLTLSPVLETPYPDAPHLTPWTRFGKRAADRAAEAQRIARRAISPASPQEGTDG